MIPNRRLEKNPDYFTAYADNVLVEIKDEVCRLMFYQNDIEFENGKLDKERTDRLRFEIRLPRETLIRFSRFVAGVTHLQAQIDEGIDFVSNPELDKKYDELNAKVDSLVYDSNPNIPHDNDLKKLEDDFTDLLNRVKRERQHEPE